MAELTRLIERLEWADKVLNALPSDHYAQVPPGAEAVAALKAVEAERIDTKQLLDRACEVNIQIQAERDKAETDLTAARAEAAEWKRHYDKATERLAAYSRDFVAEHNSLTAARAEIERLYEHLRSIRHEYETSGQLSGAMLSRTTALLGEQGK
jgi:chromosome segregation ATPase